MQLRAGVVVGLAMGRVYLGGWFGELATKRPTTKTHDEVQRSSWLPGLGDEQIVPDVSVI
jgi:hypothetical protein